MCRFVHYPPPPDAAKYIVTLIDNYTLSNLFAYKCNNQCVCRDNFCADVSVHRWHNIKIRFTNTTDIEVIEYTLCGCKTNTLHLCCPQTIKHTIKWKNRIFYSSGCSIFFDGWYSWLVSCCMGLDPISNRSLFTRREISRTENNIHVEIIIRITDTRTHTRTHTYIHTIVIYLNTRFNYLQLSLLSVMDIPAVWLVPGVSPSWPENRWV